VRPEALLMDVTSVKRAPVDAMLRASCASVVGTHPMFAPSVHSLQGQRVVLCPGRGREWEEWVRRMFHARGLVVTEADPAHHDRVMAVVQVLVHYRTEVMGKALADLGVSIEETLKFTSPIYLLDLMMTARHFGQSADLYAAIGMSNPAADEVTAAFAAAAADVRDLIVKSDQKGFHQLFKDVRSYFGDFTDEAMDQSSYLIDRLVERS
jgi:prephenate dehydrogenase